MDCDSIGRTPLSSSALEQRAADFTRRFSSAFTDNKWDQGFIATKLVAEQFLKDVFALPDSERNQVLERAQQLNDKAVCKADPSALPVLNIVFNNEGDGHAKALQKFSITQRYNWGATTAAPIVQELYQR